jgi:hypothetical protein
VILVLSTLVLLLVVMHQRFGMVTRVGVLIAAGAAGASYWQEVTAPPVHGPVCTFPLQRTKDNDCYSPRVPVQFERHLRECAIVPGAPPPSGDAPAQDSRGVPCDFFDQYANRH